MNARNITLIIVLAVILILGGCGCQGYNRMVDLDENVKSKNGPTCRAIISVVPILFLTW